MFSLRFRFPAEHILSFFNLFLFALIATVFVLVFLLSSKNFEDLAVPLCKQEKVSLPKNPFAQPAEAYEKIGEGPLSLQWVPPQLQLPDLRNELLYFGKNERPDVSAGSQFFYIGLKGKGERKTVQNGERIYLAYQGAISNATLPSKGHPGHSTPLWGESSHFSSKGTYTFSPDNQPTPLWFEIHPLNEEVLEISLEMLDEKGCYVESPQENRSFILSKSEGGKVQQGTWEIGGQRVDTTFLIRQKVRWIGLDVFLEKHGGEEFAFAHGRQRLDFTDAETPYVCFVKPDDFLIWKEGRWQLANPGENTLAFPLMTIKKIDEKVMLFDLWDTDGKTKLTLSVLRARDYEPMPNLEHEFKFVGAKTWAQFIVECRSQRLILRPHDWLLLTKEGWQKINSPEEVDNFVSQKISGPLFILEKMTKKNGRQVLVGHLFNTARTEVQEVELLAVQSPLLNSYPQSLSLPPPLKAEAVQELKGDER